jgi:transposase
VERRGELTMTQAERDRLVVLRKAEAKSITQKEAAEELGVTERQVRRLVAKLREQGDRAVIHGLRGRASNRRLSEEKRAKAVAVLSQEVYRGFGPTLASEYWARKHKLEIGREAPRQLMMEPGQPARHTGTGARDCRAGRGAELALRQRAGIHEPAHQGWCEQRGIRQELRTGQVSQSGWRRLSALLMSTLRRCWQRARHMRLRSSLYLAGC